MERSGPTPCALCLASLLCGSGAGGAPTAAAEGHCCWTAAGLLLEHMYVLICICIHLVLERAPTGRLSPTSPSLPGSGWLAGGVRGKRDLHGRF